MKKLDRKSIPTPSCLGGYQHGKDQWNQVIAEHKVEIRGQLQLMQGRLCAYCEGSLDELGEHIEHLRPRARHPQRTFDWNNLYWSCEQDDSCGRYKDHSAGKYDVDELVDPCCHNPDDYFRFRGDGSIDFVKNLSTSDEQRAKETLRVFNLNPMRGRLRTMRKSTADIYNTQEPNIVRELMDWDEDERRHFIEEELHRTSDKPFGAVIRHLFVDMVGP
jgi:uncharacterized protein (TIGR02646 family)